MVVAVARAQLWIGVAASLKDRRRVVRSIVDRLRARYNLCVVELDEPQVWQRAEVAMACVACSEGQAKAVLTAARRLVEQYPDAELTAFELSFYS